MVITRRHAAEEVTAVQTRRAFARHRARRLLNELHLHAENAFAIIVAAIVIEVLEHHIAHAQRIWRENKAKVHGQVVVGVRQVI